MFLIIKLIKSGLLAFDMEFQKCLSIHIFFKWIVFHVEYNFRAFSLSVKKTVLACSYVWSLFYLYVFLLALLYNVHFVTYLLLWFVIASVNIIMSLITRKMYARINCCDRGFGVCPFFLCNYMCVQLFNVNVIFLLFWK